MIDIDFFVQRIKPLTFMEMCAIIVVQYDNPADAFVFLDNAEKRVKADPVALALCKITRGKVILEKQLDILELKVSLSWHNLA